MASVTLYWILWLLQYFCPLWRCSLSHGGSDTDVPFGAGHATVTYSQHPDQLYESVLLFAPLQEASLSKADSSTNL